MPNGWSGTFRPPRHLSVGNHRIRWTALVPVLVTVVLVLVASGPPVSVPSAQLADAGRGASGPGPFGPLTPLSIDPYDSVVPGSRPSDLPAPGSLHILLTLNYANQTSLSGLLSALSSPVSPAYHHYLTPFEFESEYSPSVASWNEVLDYVQGFEVSNLTANPDRVTIGFDASPSVLDEMFHTSIQSYVEEGRDYFAPSTPPEVPRSIAELLAEVDGLGTYSRYLLAPLGTAHVSASHRSVERSPPSATNPAGYPSPVTLGGVQYEYSSDFQVAYDEQSLFQEYSYPRNATIATILWSGTYTGTSVSTPCGLLTTGEAVGPWVPSDVYSFFNETVPTGEPHASLTAVPILGAPAPSCLASWDGTGANFENTLDLEMVGSTAPGAQIYNVYGGQPTSTDVDQAFSDILSPPNTLSSSVRAGLLNVTVISNSWGATDKNDTNWYMDLEQAQARGISVLASSGDSDDSNQSSKYVGSTVAFPSSMAYDAFGDTAVGGTTVVLNPTSLHLVRQVVWSELGVAGGPYGSTGGISSVFPEPTWQATTEANAEIDGAGRGVPDVSGLANNTLVTVSVDGHQYNATNASSGGEFYYMSGTSVASPLTAGMVGEIDHVLKSADNPWLGFLNPYLYALAKRQYAPLPSNATGLGAEATGPYLYSLPTTPFYDVTSGANELYAALPGYDLVTGWGSIDAYNYTMYALEVPFSRVKGDLSGVQDHLDLTGLNVTTAGNSEYNASTQQNFFLANSLGAPVYWVQNVVYIHGSPADWQMTFAGWVVFPYWPFYPADTIYAYNWPTSSLTESTPLNFNFSTELVNPGELSAMVEFSFGVAGADPMSLPVPGASYLIGSLGYNYSWQGTNYSNGDTPYYSAGPGFLSPQFGLLGGPSGGAGDFKAPTAGTLSVWLEPWGTSSWVAASTESFGESISQSGESAENLEYAETTGNNWSFGTYSGSSTQGVLAYENEVPATYSVQFNQTGVPAGTPWYVNLSSGARLTGVGLVGHLSALVTNGSYGWTAGIGAENYSVTPTSGTVNVAGAAVYVDLAFTKLPSYLVEFNQTGVPSSSEWFVNVTGGPDLRADGGRGSLSTSLAPGSYAWTAAVGATNWTVHPDRGTLVVSANAVYVDLVVDPPPAYALEFSAVGLPVSSAWFVNLSNGVQLSAPGSTSSLTFDVVNGTYSYSAGVGAANWTVAPSSGQLLVQGEGRTVELTYAPRNASVLVRSTGLPAGTVWWVNVSGGQDYSSSGASFSVVLDWGVYSYRVASSDPTYAPSAYSGTLRIPSETEAWVNFSRVTYDLSAVATDANFAASTPVNWTFEVGDFRGTSSNPVVLVPLANGTYSFSASVAPGYSIRPASGSVSIEGEPTALNLTISRNGTVGSGAASPPIGGLALAIVLALAGAGVAATVVFVVARRRRPKAPALTGYR